VPRGTDRPTTYVCMLRAVNVGGTTIKMERLRELFVGLGYSSVSTYIQSGNVIFTTPGRPADVGAAIEQRITEELGISVNAVLRSGPQLAQVVSVNPFIPLGADTAKLHVTFLAGRPPTGATDIELPNVAPDDFRIIGEEVYLHCPGGYGTTKLTNAFWERRLRIGATTRNWRTVTKLLELSGGLRAKDP
jgi:uncharacterized protein (DUF1697 family)